jgi:hypothetical protein
MKHSEPWSGGGKLQNFSAPSYRFAGATRVFHLLHGLPLANARPGGAGVN